VNVKTSLDRSVQKHSGFMVIHEPKHLTILMQQISGENPLACEFPDMQLVRHCFKKANTGGADDSR